MHTEVLSKGERTQEKNKEQLKVAFFPFLFFSSLLLPRITP